MWDLDQVKPKAGSPKPDRQQAAHLHVGGRLLAENSLLHFFEFRNDRTGNVGTVFTLPRDADRDRVRVQQFGTILREYEGSHERI